MPLRRSHIFALSKRLLGPDRAIGEGRRQIASEIDPNVLFDGGIWEISRQLRKYRISLFLQSSNNHEMTGGFIIDFPDCNWPFVGSSERWSRTSLMRHSAKNFIRVGSSETILFMNCADRLETQTQMRRIASRRISIRTKKRFLRGHGMG